MKSFFMFLLGIIVGAGAVYRLGTQSIEALLDNGMEGLVEEIQNVESGTGGKTSIDEYKKILVEKIEEEKNKLTDNVAQSLNTAITQKINNLLGKE